MWIEIEKTSLVNLENVTIINRNSRYNSGINDMNKQYILKIDDREFIFSTETERDLVYNHAKWILGTKVNIPGISNIFKTLEQEPFNEDERPPWEEKKG